VSGPRVHDRTAAYADRFGWAPLTVGDHGLVTAWYSWDSGERVEVHVLYDKAGRIEAWSVWRNRRVRFPDQQAGMRERLDDYLTCGGSRREHEPEPYDPELFPDPRTTEPVPF
jgi:hypothetical protein